MKLAIFSCTIHFCLCQIHEISSAPIFAKGFKLSKALTLLQRNLDAADGNQNGYVTAMGIVTLFSDTLNYLSAQEAHHLTKYIVD